MTEHWRRHPVGVSQQGALLREACWTLCSGSWNCTNFDGAYGARKILYLPPAMLKFVPLILRFIRGGLVSKFTFKA